MIWWVSERSVSCVSVSVSMNKELPMVSQEFLWHSVWSHCTWNGTARNSLCIDHNQNGCQEAEKLKTQLLESHLTNLVSLQLNYSKSTWSLYKLQKQRLSESEKSMKYCRLLETHYSVFYSTLHMPWPEWDTEHTVAALLHPVLPAWSPTDLKTCSQWGPRAASSGSASSVMYNKQCFWKLHTYTNGNRIILVSYVIDFQMEW